MIARIVFSSCWVILWCIKTNFLLKYCMQWLQEYCFLDVATLCDASRQIFFSCIVCSICKSMISFILWCIKTHFVLKFMNAVILQDYCFLPDGTLCGASKRFFFEVMYAVIARVLFSSCWGILWCIKTNLVWRWQMQWLQKYKIFYVCWTIVWCFKTNFLFKYCMQWLQEYCFLHVGTFSDESKRI